MVLEKTLEILFDCNEIQPVHPKGDQSWVFIGRTDAEAETPILWLPHAKSWLIWKDPDAGRDWGQEEKGMTKDEMAVWHHRLDGHEFEWTPGVGDGQGGLACCDSWGHKESDTTERLNWTELIRRNDFLGDSAVKNLPAEQETQETGFDPWVGKIPWRRAWQPTPVFLPEESRGQRSLTGSSPWSCKESEPTAQGQNGETWKQVTQQSELTLPQYLPRVRNSEGLIPYNNW